MAMYGLPGCSRDSEFFESDVSTVSALTVCFCCLASDTPVINAITCTHTEFVQQYFAEWNNQKLAICYTCHFMLKKIEIFRRQVRESLDLLSDYQHTKEHNLNRPRLVNNLVTTDLVVTSTSDVKNAAEDVVPIEIDVDEELETSKEGGEDSDDEPTEKIEIATNLLEPASVVLEKPEKKRKKRKKLFTPKKQRGQPRWWPKSKQFEAKFLPETSMLSINDFPPTNSTAKNSITTENNVPLSKFITEKSITIKKIGSTTISLKKKSINTLKNSPTTEETTEKNTSPSNFLTEKSKKIGSTTISLTKNSMKAKTNASPTNIPAKVKKSTYWLAQELARLRREPLALKLAKLRGDEQKKIHLKCIRDRHSKIKEKNLLITNVGVQQQHNEIQPTKAQEPFNVKIFSMKEYLHDSLDEKYNGKIKVTYLTQDELMREREAEKQKEFYLKKPYKCESCIQGFTEKARYKNHVSKNHPFDRTDYETSCEVCDTAIKTSRGIRRHLKDHVLRYVCVPCGKTSRMLELIDAHYKLAHSEKSIKCKDCNKTFSRRKNMLLHRRQEHKKECIYCKRGFLNLTDIQNHYSKKHPDESPFKCKHCTESFKHPNELYRHRTSIHNIRGWKRNNKTDNKDENIIVIEDNEHEFEGTENNESIFDEMENTANTGHDDSIETENNDHEFEDNIVEDCIDIVKDEHNIIELENIQHNIVELVNTDHNIVGLENNDHNIVGFVNNDHNIVELVNNDPNIVGMEIVEPNIVGMEIIEPNIVGIENNEHNIVETVNDEHQDDVMGENDLNNMDQDIEYNILGEKEDQSCIIGL